ncbi:MAG TPA: hypothetical protein VGL56_00205 [Fimbriimonadaceae bacterium]|jgi:hypothetical protein
MKFNARVLAGCVVVLLSLCPAVADVYGRLKFIVKNADDEKPLTKGNITLEDSTNVHPKVTLKIGPDGTITTDPLEVRAWHITTSSDNFEDDKRDVTVVRDTTTEVEVLMEPVKEKTITIKASKTTVKTSDVSTSSVRDQQFRQEFPTSSNPQSLQKELVTAPGMVLDSNGQVHPGGEHNATTIYINGYQLPGAFQGKFGQVLSGTAAQSIDVQTGGYAPEYGSEAAAILNVDLRAGTVNPFFNYDAEAGSFKTLFDQFTFGGQLGQPYGEPLDSGQQARRFSYFVDVTRRSTAKLSNRRSLSSKRRTTTAFPTQASETSITKHPAGTPFRSSPGITPPTTRSRTEPACPIALPLMGKVMD